MSVRRCAWISQVCTCVWDEFSEFLLENRVPTSADFNKYVSYTNFLSKSLRLVFLFNILFFISLILIRREKIQAEYTVYL